MLSTTVTTPKPGRFSAAWKPFIAAGTSPRWPWTRPGSPSKGRSCHRWGVPRWSWWSASDELGGAKMSQKWSFYHGKRMTIQWFHQQKVGIGPWKLWIATILCCVIGIYNDNILYIYIYLSLTMRNKRKSQLFMVNTWVSLKLSVKPSQWLMI